MLYWDPDALGKISLGDARYAALDIETTGVKPFRDRVVEVGVVVWQRGRRSRELSLLVNPEVPVSEGARRVHGISDRELGNAPPFRAVAGEILGLLEGCVIVGHRALSFDIPFLSMEACRAGRPPILNPVIDTSLVSRESGLVPTDKRDLSSMMSSLEMPRTQKHRALPDARAALRLWLFLLDKFLDYGKTTLRDILPYFRFPELNPEGLRLMRLSRSSPDGSLVIVYGRGRGREERRVSPILPKRDSILVWSHEREAPRTLRYDRMLDVRIP